MKKPVISIVGKSNTGKTTFIEKLIPELKNRGYKVGTIKHHSHKELEFDKEGKDSWRHMKAGSDSTMLASPSGFGLVKLSDQNLSIDELVWKYFQDVDIVLTEGYKTANMTKIEMLRKEKSTDPLCDDPEKDKVLAYVSDFDFSYKNIPVFDSNDAKGVADRIEERFLKDKRKYKVKIMIDGKVVPMKDFVEDFVEGTITGMLSSLKKVELPAKEINIIINSRDGEII